MKVSIYQPVGFTETGGRTNNEDSIYPTMNAISPNQRLFLVCDGVGGQHKGEIASALACESIAFYFAQNLVEVANEPYVQSALKYTTDAFVQKEKEDSETQGMATTLTLLHFNEAGATIAHLGDSRIYQVRNGAIVRVSEDHKLVNELVRGGHITSEEALSHAQRNVITKVISADRQDKPDVQIINDVQAGDYFFLCTDGVLEQVYDDLLVYHLRNTEDNELSDAQKLENIRQECMGKTRDNFSAYLIHVDSVTGTVSPQYQVYSPIVEAVSAPPIAMPIQASNAKITYEADAPTAFIRPALSIPNPADFAPSPEQKPLENHRPSTKPQQKATPFPLLIGITTAVLAAGGGIWFWIKNKPLAKQEITAAPVLAPISIDTIQPKKAVVITLPKPKIQQKKPLKSMKLNSPSRTVIVQSSKNKFSIIKEGDKYFCWDEKKKKKVSIYYDNEYDRLDNIAYRYSFDNKKWSLYLAYPDKIIPRIDEKSILSQHSIVYYVEGKATKINPKTGKTIRSIKDMQAEAVNP